MNWQEWSRCPVRQSTVLRNKQCAVLVPLIRIKDEWHLLFEIRSSHLSWQPGDICFPGGSLEQHDRSTVDGAVRETVEELGIDSSLIHILGSLDYVESPVGMTIWPVAACIDTDSFRLSDGEVEETFTVPLKWFIQNEPVLTAMEISTKPAEGFPYDLLPQVRREWQKRKKYDIYIYPYEDKVIWGITAHIIRNFVERFCMIEGRPHEDIKGTKA